MSEVKWKNNWEFCNWKDVIFEYIICQIGLLSRLTNREIMSEPKGN